MSIHNKIMGAIIRNFQAVIIMHFKVQSNMISFTSRLLESNHINNCELAINNGCQYFDQAKLLGLAKEFENSSQKGKINLCPY